MVAQAQTSLPPDIDPVTLSRLPPVTPEDLDEEGKKLLAARPDFKPGPGRRTSRVQPEGAQPRDPSGENSPVGARDFQLAVLIMAREIDQQYEWSAHEPAGLRQGLEQSVIDVVKNNKERHRPVRQGRHVDHLRTHAVSRAPREQRAVAEDDRTLRASAYRAAHDDHGRLLQGGLHDERRRSAPSADAEACCRR